MTITAYTTAPAAYDYDTVLESEDWGITAGGETVRKLTLRDSRYHVDYQLGRYASGMYLATEDAEIAAAVCVDCPECNGSGTVDVRVHGRRGPGLGYIDGERDCETCDGTGRVDR